MVFYNLDNELFSLDTPSSRFVDICPPLDQPSGLWRGSFSPDTFPCALNRKSSGPLHDPRLLTERVCAAQGWQIAGIHFYTGIPSATDKPFWNSFWTAKLGVMDTRGIQTFSRALRNRNQTVALADGSLTVTLVGQEKGVDVRIALDIVRFALEARYEVALIFSQDQDLSEAVQDVKKISVLQNRWI